MNEDLKETLVRIADDPQNGPMTRKAARDALKTLDAEAVVVSRDTSNGDTGHNWTENEEKAYALGYRKGQTNRPLMPLHVGSDGELCDCERLVDHEEVQDTSDNTDEGELIETVLEREFDDAGSGMDVMQPWRWEAIQVVANWFTRWNGSPLVSSVRVPSTDTNSPTEWQRKLLAENPEFRPATINVVIEDSEVGMTAWDNGGRHIVVEPEQIVPVSSGTDRETLAKLLRDQLFPSWESDNFLSVADAVIAAGWRKEVRQ